MKSLFNSLYAITKAPKKLKAIPNAVDLEMDPASTQPGQKTQMRISPSTI